MKNIWFKMKYYDPIDNGKKTQTIRFWKRKTNYKNGDLFECFFGNVNKPKLVCTILDIQEKLFKEITLDEVKMDGFETKEKLYLELKKYYENFSENEKLQVIKFKRNGEECIDFEGS